MRFSFSVIGDVLSDMHCTQQLDCDGFVGVFEFAQIGPATKLLLRTLFDRAACTVIQFRQMQSIAFNKLQEAALLAFSLRAVYFAGLKFQRLPHCTNATVHC